MKMNNSELHNISSNTSEAACFRDTVITQRILPLLYLAIFIGGLFLNSLAAWIFVEVSHHSSFTVYLKNIVVADILMSLTFPVKIISDSGLGSWELKVFICRFSAVIFYLNMYIGIIFLGLISFDRYIKIVKQSGTFVTPAFARTASAAVWIFMLVLLVPNIILTSNPATQENSQNCMNLKSYLGRRWHEVSNYMSVAIFWIVLILLVVCYTLISKKVYDSYRKFRRNSEATTRRSTRNIFSIIIIFFLCFVPYHVCRLPYTFSQTTVHFNCQMKTRWYYIKEITLLLSSLNVCLDPTIYFLLCRSFRELLMRKLHFQLRSSRIAEFLDTQRRSSTAANSESIL
ncbi:P2Y purinoceptor 14 [Protopterus annectens]|uniref:P2Y purinoceptor 14 n=1 Tax=Protopterus annectens TaxID=7888 RepID=UPI001CFB2137|nr:P2Y purinoceptor 14 [Protopterus annectens]